MDTERRLHVVHLVYRYASGGLENVVAQLINGLDARRYRHTLVAVTDIDPAYRARLQAPNLQCIEFRKPQGSPLPHWPRMYRLLRNLQPDTLHCCNLAAMDFLPVAWAARVPWRVYVEHGWDASDAGGTHSGRRRNRQLMAPFAHRCVAVSKQIEVYLRDSVGLPARRIVRIDNGVDTTQFRPAEPGGQPPAGWPWSSGGELVIGTVGRLDPVKDQARLLQALAALRARDDDGAKRVRLALVGDGPLGSELQAQAHALGLDDAIWWAGTRQDVPALLRHFDVFVLNSIAEGTSCALQEALATGLPVVATAVGGNAELLDSGRLGILVPPSDTQALTAALRAALQLAANPQRRDQQCLAARKQVEARYGLPVVLARYDALLTPPA
jgi:sugar transferase (PEP-CTERM/EpsH1 system associated)